MANKTIGGSSTATSTPLTTTTTIDAVQDYLPIYQNATQATLAINRNSLLGITGNPIGNTDVQTLSNKTIGNTNTVTLKDTLFTLQDDADATKQAVFQLASISTATTRTYTLPNVSDTLVTLGATQTLTNKTLTSPAINTPIITNATISADAVSGFTTSNSGMIYGLSITTGKIAGASITNATVGPNQLATGAQAAIVLTSESSSSTSYVDLTTTTDTITVTIGTNGLALVSIYASMSNNLSNDASYVGFIMSGSNTASATDSLALVFQAYGNNATGEYGATFLLTALSPGSTTFKMKYRVSAGQGTWANRRIAVVPL
jgi:hypothetical protein